MLIEKEPLLSVVRARMINPVRFEDFPPGLARAALDIEAAPAVDAVEVVRCKDCIKCGFCGDQTNLEVMGFNGFCSRGKKREENDEL